MAALARLLDEAGWLEPAIDSIRTKEPEAVVEGCLAPDDARETLQAISDRNEYPQAAEARGTISALARDLYAGLMTEDTRVASCVGSAARRALESYGHFHLTKRKRNGCAICKMTRYRPACSFLSRTHGSR